MSALSPLDLLAASLLTLIVGALSLAYRLELERRLAIAVVRMIVQLLAVGLVLKLVIEQSSPVLTAGLALVMVLAAGYAAATSQERQIGRWQAYLLGTGTLFAAGLVASVFALAVVVAPTPWYAPRYALPILGLILGNALTGVSLVLDTLLEAIDRERTAIEARLALGESRMAALAEPLRRALKTGLVPMLNTMAVAGAVALPGMMSGQILAGADPLEAAKAQIMILLVQAGGTGLAVVLAALGAVHLLTDRRHRLRLERLSHR